jgi:hypothetical protein
VLLEERAIPNAARWRRLVMQKATGQEINEQWSKNLELRIRDALREIRYGTVTLVIQDSRVIQIDKSEKIRLK